MNETSRRAFLKASSGAALALTTAVHTRQPIAVAASPEARPWYRNAWRRAVIDMHIPDWDEAFLSKFDPLEYAAMLERSRAQSVVCYCHSHVGLFNYPTKVGKQHESFRGRNVLQEMIDACHEKEIAVVLYCSLIFDRWCGDTYPQWRMRRPDGEIHGLGDRHCVMCVNSPYRDYVQRFVQEICETFDFEGIRFDMTFWPWLCYCQHCKHRYDQEVGGEMPTTINWLDKKWVAFQRMRERSIVEFAKLATDTVKEIKPHASVEHQSSTYPLNWMFGVTEPLTQQNDFLQGDFYGDQLQGSFVRKLLERLTPNRPFGYETSFSMDLKDHTAMKSEALLEAKASAAIADSAAFIFIDAIDPVGTVNHRAHDRMGKIFDRLLPCYDELGGERVEDIGIFYSLESKFSMQGNGKSVNAPDTSDTHTESSMQVAARLIRSHLPFGVITQSTLDALKQLRVLVLSSVHMMEQQECEVIRQWVREGGKLLATGGSSLVNKLGQQQDDFMLADVFGVSIVQADWSNRPHYLTPTELGQAVLPDFSPKYPAFSQGQGFQIKAHPGTEVLAKTVLPWPRTDGTRFSSIHSDPPWVITEQPEITRHAFGRGEAIYCATLIENMENAEDALVKLIRLLNDSYQFQVDAPTCVEATLFRQADRHRYLFSLLNFQKELPNLAVHDIRCRLNVAEPIRAVRLLGDNRSIPIERMPEGIQFTAPQLETLLQFEAVWS